MRGVTESREELGDWLTLTRAQVKRAVRRLKERQLLTVRRQRRAGRLYHVIHPNVERCLGVSLLYTAPDRRR